MSSTPRDGTGYLPPASVTRKNESVGWLSCGSARTTAAVPGGSTTWLAVSSFTLNGRLVCGRAPGTWPVSATVTRVLAPVVSAYAAQTTWPSLCVGSTCTGTVAGKPPLAAPSFHFVAAN